MSRPGPDPAGRPPEFRTDPFGRFDVWVAPSRAGRPNEFRDGAKATGCPLCEGNERETTPETAALRKTGSTANGPGWAARIVTNLYPATSPAIGGRHEVLIESPRHATRLHDLAPGEIADVLGLVQSRVRALVAEGFANVTLFKNSGPRAGASLSHPHSQIMALREAPILAAREAVESGARCRACDAVAAERAAGVRVVAERDGFACYAPAASRFHCEMVVVPVAHPASFVAADRASLTAFAAVLKDALSRLDRVLDSPPFNVVMHLALARGAPHWRAEILPRVTGLGGFELGAGAFINSMAPEDAAIRLRDARS